MILGSYRTVLVRFASVPLIFSRHIVGVSVSFSSLATSCGHSALHLQAGEDALLAGLDAAVTQVENAGNNSANAGAQMLSTLELDGLAGGDDDMGMGGGGGSMWPHRNAASERAS